MAITHTKLTEFFAEPSSELKKLKVEEQYELIEILTYDNLLASFAAIYDIQLQALVPQALYRQVKTVKIHANRLKHLCYHEMLGINKLLSDYDIKPIFLKGGAYIAAKVACSNGRMFSDIDFLVEKDELLIAEKILKKARWVSKTIDDYDDNYYREWAHEIPPLFHYDRYSIIDMHHNIAMPISGRAPNIETIKKNVLADRELATLSPEGMTLHSAIHLFFNEEFNNGFRDLYDLHLLMSENGSTNYWKNLVNMAKNSDFTLELFLATRYCKRFFNTNIPDSIEIELNKSFTHKTKHLLWDFIFMRVLSLKHPKVKPRFHELASFLAFIRGHYLKMPLLTLIKHLCHKAWHSSVEQLLGRAFFEKPDNNVKL